MQAPSARINLLPYREQRVKELRVHFFVITSIVMVIGVLAVLGVDFFLGTFVVSQEERVEQLKQKIAAQETEIQEIAKLKKEIEALIGRKSVIESLQNEKNNPILLFNALVKSIPQGLYLESFTQSGTTITISAIADGNATISGFISNLESNKEIFQRVSLGNSNQFDYGTQKFFRFTLSVNSPLYQKK